MPDPRTTKWRIIRLQLEEEGNRLQSNRFDRLLAFRFVVLSFTENEKEKTQNEPTGSVQTQSKATAVLLMGHITRRLS